MSKSKMFFKKNYPYILIVLVITLLLAASKILDKTSEKKPEGVIDIEEFCDEEVKYEINDVCVVNEETIRLTTSNYAGRAIDSFFLKIYGSEEGGGLAKISGVNAQSENTKELTDVMGANEVREISLLPSIVVGESNYLCINKEKKFGSREGSPLKRCEE